MTNTEIFDRIRKDIESHEVVLYMKGTTEMPLCGFSATVCNILNKLGLQYQSFDILQDAELREGIKQFSDWPTIPQLYLKGDFVGGCDIVKEMYQSNELIELLIEKKISYAVS